MISILLEIFMGIDGHFHISPKILKIKKKSILEHCHSIGAFCKDMIFRLPMMIIILEKLLHC